MRNSGLRRNHKNRRFNYKPVYYDEAKEDLKFRVERAKAEMGEAKLSEANIKHQIRGVFKENQYHRRPKYKAPKTAYRIRLFILAIVITIILYLIFDSQIVERITNAFLK